MEPKTDVMAWLSENLQRFLQKSPTFFKVWTIINGILLFISGLPVILTQFGFTDLNILPAYVLKIIAFAAAWGLFMSKLPVKNSKDVTVEGDIVIQKPKPSLPFTEKKEAPVVVDQK